MNRNHLPSATRCASLSVCKNGWATIAALALVLLMAILNMDRATKFSTHIRSFLSYRGQQESLEPKQYILEEVSGPLKPLTDNVQPNFFAAAFMLVHPKWATRKGKKKCYFNTSMSYLEKHWRPNNPYPLYLLTNRPWTRFEMQEIRRLWPRLDISFLDISSVFDILPRLDPSQPRYNNFSVEYTQMCAFNVYGFLQIPSLLRYRYLMRIDDDTCVLNSINFDVFKEMQMRNASYSYAASFEDPYRVTVGMKEFAENYMTSRGLPWANGELKRLADEMYKQSQSAPCFATNWEVMDTLRYRQPDILSFVQEIKDSRMIFYRRWGDAPLRFLLAEMFWGPREVLRLCDFAYQHGKQSIYDSCAERTEIDPVQRYDLPRLRHSPSFR